MSNTIEHKDMVAFHPGYYIAETIQDMGITQAEFALRLGTNVKTLSYLVNGQANITNDLAKKLSVMLGTSEELWLNLQNEYDKRLIMIQKKQDSDDQSYIARMIDYSFFVSFAGLPETKNSAEKVENLCKYFKVADLRNMMAPDFLIGFPESVEQTISKTEIINSRAWLQTAINYSKDVKTGAYSASRIKEILPSLRSMTVMKPDSFMPMIKKSLSECGIAFALIPNLKNSGIKSAVRWVGDNKAVLALSNLNLDVDSFWFSLFKEVKHVLQKKVKTTFVSYTDGNIPNNNDTLEMDADLFARNLLIPKADLKRFAPSKETTDAEIYSFAKEIGIHPGIVAGRLQYDGIISATRSERLKEKYFIQ